MKYNASKVFDMARCSAAEREPILVVGQRGTTDITKGDVKDSGGPACWCRQESGAVGLS